MTDRMYTPDVENPAWEAFTASLDPVQLEAERMRAPETGERFGSREHHAMLEQHETARDFYLSATTLNVVPVSGPVRVNPYQVRVGQTWMRTNGDPVKHPPVEVIGVGVVDATVYWDGHMRSIPLAKFHGARGGYERVVLRDRTPKPRRKRQEREMKFAAWQMSLAVRVGEEKAVGGAVGRSERVTPASAGENISAKVNPATGLVASKESSNERRAA